MDPVIAWVEAHPYLMAAVGWPFALAVLTLLLKPRTKEEYAAIAKREPEWFFPRWAAFLQLLGALGLDPVKVLKVLKKILDPKNNTRSGLPMLGLALVFGLTSCTPQALSVLDLLARKTQCAIAFQDLPNEEILKRCAIDAADAKTILDLVGESRQMAAEKANQAEERGRIAAALHCHDDAGVK